MDSADAYRASRLIGHLRAAAVGYFGVVLVLQKHPGHGNHRSSRKDLGRFRLRDIRRARVDDHSPLGCASTDKRPKDDSRATGGTLSTVDMSTLTLTGTTMENNASTYDAAWDRLRFLQRKVRRLVFAFLVILPGISLLLKALSPPKSTEKTIGAIVVLSGVTVMFLIVHAMLKLFSWPCPRCGKPFYSGAKLGVWPGEQCGYCGLWVFQERD